MISIKKINKNLSIFKKELTYFFYFLLLCKSWKSLKKLNLKLPILLLPVNPFFVFFIIFIYIYIYTYIVSIKTSKNLSIKYYQENKERLQIKARERYQNFS